MNKLKEFVAASSLSNNVQKITDIELCIDSILKKIGKNIKLGIPLGAGKPNQFVNAFYLRAKKDPSINLTILSALTLEKPKGKSLLERRFMEPFAERVFGDYPDLLYEADRQTGNLPPNIRVIEFYFPAGKYSSNPQVQRDYISSNYTHVARDLVDRGINVVAQLVCKSEDGERLSLSCNPDVTTDLMKVLDPRETAFVAQVNNNLPYMYGDADVPIDTFHYLIDNPDYDFKIFGPPKMSVPDPDYMIGLYASTLVKDGGELQVGIGSLGDALVYAILLRHLENDQYKECLNAFKIKDRFGKIIKRKGETKPFEKGLFAASEMFVDGFMELFKNKIIKRKVYDHLILQRLLNEGLIDENKISPGTLYHLLAKGAIQAQLSKEDFDFLQHFGILKPELAYRHGYIFFPDDTFVDADLNNDHAQERLIENGLGDQLKNGAVIHGGFFLGPTAFYDWLRNLPEEERRLIHMKSVQAINQLYGHEELDKLHRKDARFFNTCLLMTLMGAAVSDGLEDGRLISGVGEQYNFVDMAHALPDGHSVIQLRATRFSKGKLQSNIVWNYGHTTIPRHLRDIVITEYGIADIRGKTDEEVIQALIQIADSRFQSKLVKEAKATGKLNPDYEIPEAFRSNYPQTISKKLAAFKKKNLFPTFPFGTDFTKEEQELGKALKTLKKQTASPISKALLILKALFSFGTPDKILPYLKRMALDQPKGIQEKLYQKLLIWALKQE